MDHRDVWREVYPRLRSIGSVLGLLFSVLVFAGLAIIPFFIATETGLVSVSNGERLIYVTVFQFPGMGIGAWVYLHLTGRQLDYINYRIPTHRDWIAIAGGVVSILVLFVIVNLLAAVLSAPSQTGAVTRLLSGNTDLIAPFILIVIFLNAPIEELVFRGVVQTRLTESFSTVSAVLLTNIIFSAIHIGNYTGGSEPLSMVTPLVIIFMLSTILCVSYVYSKNILVPIGVHAAFNIIQALTLLA